MFDPNYNKYQNVSMDQNMNKDYFGEAINNPYIRGVTTHMPQPMPGNVTENNLYPLMSSLATPQFNSAVEQVPQGFAKGGMVRKSTNKGKKEKNSPYPLIAEMIRRQGKGEDSILAHINPLEAMMLQQMGGSGTINPATGLPQFGFLKSFGKAISGIASSPFKALGAIAGKDRSVRNAPRIEASPNPVTDIARYNPSPNVVIPRAKSSNEELLDKLRNQIYMDQAGLANTNYVPYRGEMVAPLSPSTMRAQDLKDQWSKKGSPYSNKIETIAKRDIQGFSPSQQQALIEMLRRGTVSEDLASQRLGKQFGNNYGYESDREAALRGKIGKDINRRLDTSRNNLNNLSDELAILESRRGTSIADAFRNAGRAKEGRRNALSNQLEEFGNQERNFRNLQNQAKMDAFNEERTAPQRKITAAAQALARLGPVSSGEYENMHPGRAAAVNAQLQKVNNFYNAPYTNYPGQRVVDIDPRTQQGYNLTYQFDPKYRDKFYNERKALEKGFLSNPNIATQTYNKIPGNLEPLMANLDYLTKQQMKQESREISGRHRRMGTYGSGVHKAETEKAMRNILGRVQSEREGALLGVAKNQGRLVGENEQNALNRYGQLSNLGTKEFTDKLDIYRNMVNSGNRQWANKQELENAKLQNWYDQLNHELPIGENNQLAKKYIMPV